MSDAVETATMTPAITFEIVTLFPELFDEILRASLLGKAIASGIIAVHRTHLRDFGIGRHRSVDDTPYGGGPGMILRVEPIAAALDAIIVARGPSRRVLLSPQGARLDQRKVVELAAAGRVTLICGRYEGFDERVGRHVDEQLSIGDFVLAGGELAAAVVIEAVARLCPRRARLRHVGGRRVVLARAPRVPAMDPTARVAGRRRSRGAAVGRSSRHRALAPARSAAAHGRATARPDRGSSAGRGRGAPAGRAPGTAEDGQTLTTLDSGPPSD